jgi:hypothetical protein
MIIVKEVIGVGALEDFVNQRAALNQPLVNLTIAYNQETATWVSLGLYENGITAPVRPDIHLVSPIPQ